MQDYATIPQEFRAALETAFPQLIIYTPKLASLRRLNLISNLTRQWKSYLRAI